ncbi:MAG: Fe-S protein assembly co-chaperone HscB [Porticoccaceae bacterium]|nr:Fe-S protein assembly co-chaperone HscB [Porticoccaceae bacterium]MDG1475152.1 Fe-S protein assembly co-chaperone HscB [Porticoccaceae bacterium]
MNTSNDCFEIFSIPIAWDVDIEGLQVRYRALQKEFHPDRYADKSDAQKRLAVQTAAIINQAFGTLKSPLLRAQYLLERSGVSADQESYITTDSGFLMQQIELREALAGVTSADKPWAALERLRSTVETTYENLQSEFQQFYSAEKFDSAFNTVAKMQFFNKLLQEVEQLEYELEDL